MLSSSQSNYQSLRYVESPDFLIRSICKIIAPALVMGHGTLIIASSEFQKDVEQELRSRGINPEYLKLNEQILFLDSEQVLGTFMVENLPDENLFNKNVGEKIRKLSSDFEEVHVYGEMVDILLKHDLPDAADSLHQLWTRTARKYSARLIYKQHFNEAEESIYTQLFSQIEILNHHIYIKDLIRDINHLKEENQNIKNKILLREEFMDIATHELKTPLTSLSLQLQMIKRYMKDQSYENDTPLNRAIENCNYQSKKLTAHIEQLLDVTRICLNDLELTRNQFDLDKSIRRILDVLEMNYSRSSNSVVFKSEGPILGFWDQQRIEQAISNLLIYAIRSNNKAPIEINLSSNENRTMAYVSIKEFGQGIASEMQKRLLSNYQRPSEAHEAGVGLSLFITKKIISLHKGSFHLRSKVGEGSEFILSLPFYSEESNL